MKKNKIPEFHSFTWCIQIFEFILNETSFAEVKGTSILLKFKTPLVPKQRAALWAHDMSVAFLFDDFPQIKFHNSSRSYQKFNYNKKKITKGTAYFNRYKQVTIVSLNCSKRVCVIAWNWKIFPVQRIQLPKTETKNRKFTKKKE